MGAVIICLELVMIYGLIMYSCCLGVTSAFKLGLDVEKKSALWIKIIISVICFTIGISMAAMLKRGY